MATHRGKYLLVNALSRRVRALQSGYKPLVHRGSGNIITLAMEEFRQEKVDVSTDDDRIPGRAVSSVAAMAEAPSAGEDSDTTLEAEAREQATDEV